MDAERSAEQLYRLILEDLSAQSKILRDFQSAVVPVILRLDADVAILKTDVAMLKTDVGVLKVDVADLKTDMAILRTDVADLKTDMAILRTDVAELKTSVGRIETLLSGRDNGYS